jgi:mannose-1-phosphate guanylyltransferase
MKAMILAAGLGTRLRPLTLQRPKALMPVGNKPVIDRLIEYLKGYDISEIVVNAHHRHGQITRHLDRGRPFGVAIEVLVEPRILGTGGGIKNAGHFWDLDPFLVINGDILTDIRLDEAYGAHVENRNLATLVLHDYGPFNQIEIDSDLNIVDIGAPGHPGRLAFTGIHIMDPEVLAHIPAGRFSCIVDCYRDLIRLGKPIRAYVARGHTWRDVGTVESYVLANKEATKGHVFLLGADCFIPESASLHEWAVIGDGTYLEEGVEITRSILWEGVRVKAGKKVVDSIVTASKKVGQDLTNQIF